MLYRLASLATFRERLSWCLGLAAETSEAVRVDLGKGRVVWVVGNATLRRITTDELVDAGDIESIMRPADRPGVRSPGRHDIDGRQFGRIGLALCGRTWAPGFGRLLGLTEHGVRTLWRRDGAVPRKVAKKVKILCEEKGIDWRLM